MKPEDCPKYERCNANICPLNHQWTKRSHLPGEPVCLWLRELAKDGGEQRVLERLGGNLQPIKDVFIRLMDESLPLAVVGAGHLRRDLERASKSGSLFRGSDRLKSLRQAGQ